MKISTSITTVHLFSQVHVVTENLKHQILKNPSNLLKSVKYTAFLMSYSICSISITINLNLEWR